MRKIDVAIIAAGGNATRFRPYSLTLPKEMLPLNGRPAIEYVIDECIEACINKVIIEVKKDNECIKKHLKIHPQYRKYLCSNLDEFDKTSGVAIYIVKGTTKYKYGNAVSILSVKEYLQDKIFAVLFADDIIFGKNAIKELIDLYQNSKAKSIVAAYYKDDSEVNEYGNIKVDEESKRISMLVQKPKGYILSNYVVVSRLILDYSIFQYIDQDEIESDIGLALNLQMKEYDVLACFITGVWVSIDSPIKYKNAINIAFEMKGIE